MNRKKYINNLSKYLNNNDGIFLYWKGRVALYAILKAMNIKEGDEVIIPAYTCVVVPNAILYLKAVPIYVDIDIETYNMNINLIEEKITNKTKVIICQNTYGLSSNIDKIIDIAKQYNLYTIEDCTHGFGGKYNGKPNGTNCDASFFSTQWNKPFSTGIGGFSLINNKSLLDNIKSLEKSKLTPSLKEKLILKLLLIIHNNLLSDKTYWFLVRLYRWLSKNNLIIGSSSGNEITKVKMDSDYFKDMSSVQINAGIKALEKFPELIELRRINALKYTNFLKSNNKIYIKEYLFKNHSFLKYPLLVNDRNKFIKSAEENNIKIGDWFISPIHPIEDNFNLWNYNYGKYPLAEETSKHVVNLETNLSDVDKVINFLNKNLDNIK